MTTRIELKDMRGLISSYITGDARVKKLWAPEMKEFFVVDSVTRIIAMGHVTTVPQFLKRFNKWMDRWLETKPDRFSTVEMLSLEHACGVPSHEWERLPFFCHRYPHPKGMTHVEAGHQTSHPA